MKKARNWRRRREDEGKMMKTKMRMKKTKEKKTRRYAFKQESINNP